MSWAELAEDNPDLLPQRLREDVGFICSLAKRSAEFSKAGFIGSFLLDVLRVGGSVSARESTLRFSWPDWSGQNGREATRLALLSTKEMRPLDSLQASSLQKYFIDGIEGSTLATALSGMSFRLVQVPPAQPNKRQKSSAAQGVLHLEDTATELPLRELFELCLRHWSMPYRGRTGRSRRYVVLAAKSHNLVSSPEKEIKEADYLIDQALEEVLRDKHYEVVAGILELGDEAPFCPWRDDLLGLSPKSFCDWISENPLDNLLASIKRLRGVRRKLKSKYARSFGDFDIRKAPAKHILSHSETLAVNPALEQDDDDSDTEESFVNDELAAKKAATYAQRLVRGEFFLRSVLSDQITTVAEACQRTTPNWSSLKRSQRTTAVREALILAAVKVDPKQSGLIAGVRAIHDILLPRVHMEATVLGAVPPFSNVLGGKAIVTLLCHPAVIAAPMFSDGTILKAVFEQSLSNHLTNSGALCITTKGLYAGHSSLYNRASLPGKVNKGKTSELRLIHLANTGGATTSMLSRSTANFAWEINHHHSEATISVKIKKPKLASSVGGDYGSGGAKRHRVLEFAAKSCGIPADRISAGIRRPVYGVKLVSNAPAICWTGCEPKWLVEYPPEECHNPNSLALAGAASNTERRNILLGTLSSTATFDQKAWDTHATTHWQEKWLNKAQARIEDCPYVPGLFDCLDADSREES